MTVKELKIILEGCNDDAYVITHLEDSQRMLRDHQVYHDNDGKRVVIDIDGTYSPTSELIEEKSWKACDCEACKEHGKSQYMEAHDMPVIEIKMTGSLPSLEDFIIKWADIRKDGK